MEGIKPYEKYKDSGIAWLGEIPENWEIKRIKYIFKEQDKRSETGLEDLLSVSHYTGVTQKKDRVSDGELMTNARTLEGYKIVEEGDLVINIMLAWNGSLGISKFDGITSPAYCVYKSLIGGERYFGYLFRTKNAQQEFKKQSTGIIESRLRLYTDKFFNIKTAIPTISEQTAIANFLDYKTAKIDRFIFKKKQLIKLLNEQKAAIINDAVTKGQNPNAKMKPSGIEWLGEIPEHWEVRKIKSLGNAIIGLTYSPLELTDEGKGTLVLRSSNVQNAKITYDDCVYVTTKIPEKKRTIKGDILICSRNGSVRLIGKNAIIDEKASGQSFGAFMTIFRSSYFEYLHYFFNSASFKAQSGLFSTSTINQLTTGILNNILVAIPLDIKEQKLVVSHIEKEASIINKTIATIEKEIALVQEYRTALIAEAVTGKIDVRDYEIPAFEEDMEYAEMEEEMSLVAEEEINLD